MTDDQLLTVLKSKFSSPLICDAENVFQRFDKMELMTNSGSILVRFMWKDKVILKLDAPTTLTFGDTLNIQLEGAAKLTITQ